MTRIYVPIGTHASKIWLCKKVEIRYGLLGHFPICAFEIYGRVVANRILKHMDHRNAFGVLFNAVAAKNRLVFRQPHSLPLCPWLSSIIPFASLRVISHSSHPLYLCPTQPPANLSIIICIRSNVNKDSSVYVCVYLSVCLSVCLNVCLFVCPN